MYVLLATNVPWELKNRSAVRYLIHMRRGKALAHVRNAQPDISVLTLANIQPCVDLVVTLSKVMAYAVAALQVMSVLLITRLPRDLVARESTLCSGTQPAFRVLVVGNI